MNELQQLNLKWQGFNKVLKLFLHRVGIYYSSNGEISECKPLECIDPPTNRKERCLGCSPHRIEKKGKIPEERIPWDPPRPRLSRRDSESLVISGRSAKNTLHNNRKLQEMQNKKITISCPPTGNQDHKRKQTRARSTVKSTKSANSNRKILPDIETQSIILSHGALKLAVNFPPHSTVILKDGNREKVLQSEFCECKAIHKTSYDDDGSKASTINSM